MMDTQLLLTFKALVFHCVQGKQPVQIPHHGLGGAGEILVCGEGFKERGDQDRLGLGCLRE